MKHSTNDWIEIPHNRRSKKLNTSYPGLAALFHKLIPAFIFGVLLLVCVFAMACRNIVRYFSGYDEDEEDMMDGEDNQNNISSYKLSDNLEDTISPQNAKQLVVDSKMTDVIYTW